MDKITRFRGMWYFLSNFYPCQTSYFGREYKSVEHGYQAEKFWDPERKDWIAKAYTPGEAKRRGRWPEGKKHNWKEQRIPVMRALLWGKFTYDPVLRQMLLDTEDAELIEGNHWGDTFWGECPDGVGENHLGKLLMELREELAHGQNPDGR